MLEHRRMMQPIQRDTRPRLLAVQVLPGKRKPWDNTKHVRVVTAKPMPAYYSLVQDRPETPNEISRRKVLKYSLKKLSQLKG